MYTHTNALLYTENRYMHICMYVRRCTQEIEEIVERQGSDKTTKKGKAIVDDFKDQIR